MANIRETAKTLAMTPDTGGDDGETDGELDAVLSESRARGFCPRVVLVFNDLLDREFGPYGEGDEDIENNANGDGQNTRPPRRFSLRP